ncbi:hypothetical protein BX600DRAFT_441410 [Xylariales sp. PMI_506]|nr:hypothetical protein BX600DRAFT_441410 [Xylariales sp. PMI_506]
MAGFGEGITALLETYTKCLRLLKTFRGSRISSPHSTDAPSLESYSRLQDSLRLDRAQVQHAYSSRLSKSGRRLEKGDSRSRSTLRRILDKLKSAIVNLLSLAKTQNPVIDYESLISLSNASRVDAISTMERLSRRLSNSPSQGVRKRDSSASSRGSSHSTASKRHPLQRGAKHDLEFKPPEAVGQIKGKLSKTRIPSDRDRLTPSARHPSEKRDSNPKKLRDRVPNEATSYSMPPHDVRLQAHYRTSYISTSSDSTKLGEIPNRSVGVLRKPDIRSSREYTTAAVYPLRPYQAPVKEKRNILKRILGG